MRLSSKSTTCPAVISGIVKDSEFGNAVETFDCELLAFGTFSLEGRLPMASLERGDVGIDEFVVLVTSESS